MIAALDRLRLFMFRDLAVHWRRSVVSIGVIAAAAALLVAMMSIYGSLTGSVDRLAADISGDADFEVAAITDGGFDQSMQARIAAVPGVSVAVPMLRQTQDVGDAKFLLIGVDASIATLRSRLQDATQGQVTKLLTVPNGVAVGPGMGLAEGTRFGIGSETATVASVIGGDDAERLNGGHFVVAPLPLAQRLSDRSGHLDSVFVIADQRVDRANLRDRLDAVVDGRAVVADPDFRTAQTRQAFALIEFTLLAFAGVAFTVAGFLMFNTMNMAVTRRRPHISMLRALGGRRSAIAGDLLVEATVIGIVGASIGVPLGVLAGRWALGRLPPLTVEVLDARLEYVLPGYAVPVALLACIGASVAATVIAARQVYRVPPIEALAPVGVSSADMANGPMRVVAGAVGLVVTVLAFVVAFRANGIVAAAAPSLLFAATIPLCIGGTAAIVASAGWVSATFGASGRLGAASIARSPRRVWAAVFTVAIAVSMAAAGTGINANLIDSATRSFASMARTDLVLSTTPSNVLPAGPVLPADLQSAVSAIPGVARVVPNQWEYATVRDRRLMLEGLAPGTNSVIYSAMSEDMRRQVVAGEGVVLSPDVGAAWQVSVGDSLDLPTPHGIARVRVLGLVDVISTAVSTLAMNLMLLQEWFDRPGANYLELTLAPGADRDQVVAAVRDAAPASAYVFTGQQWVDGIAGAIKQMAGVLAGVQWIIALVAAFALLNTLMLSVMERNREIGVLRAIGSSRKSAVRMILAEAVAIGIVGGVLGLVFGATAHFLGSTALEPVATIAITYRLTPLMFLYAAGALLLCLLGAIPPAIRAARLNIIEAVNAD